MKKTLLVLILIAMFAAVLAHQEQAQCACDYFELPIEGTTGYGVIDLTLRSGDSSKSRKLGVIPAGEAFVILSEGSQYFEVDYEGQVGYAHKNYVMVNLPDLVPSVIYDAINSYDSQFRSCGVDIPNTTHEALYTGKTWNAKLGCEEYNMPALYTMAKKIAEVQSAMKADGRSLVLYEAFRPYEVQQLVNLELGNLAGSNQTVRNAICDAGWSKSWFIAKSVSNHQKGYAIDCSMASVTGFETKEIAGRSISVPVGYSILEMPTAIHELSPAAASLAYGVDSKSKTAWKAVPDAPTMNQAALELRGYCVSAGMSPLASEWWHMNDLDARAETGAKGSGQFTITCNVSRSISD